MAERINPWLERSIVNLVPLSRADVFTEACKEWIFSGEVIDYGEATEQCELCEHDELRYHFQIENGDNSNKLWVGSSCILRFEEIVVLDENKRELLDHKERKKVLDKALKAKQIDASLEPLRALWKIALDKRNTVHNMALEIKSGKSLPPDSLRVLFDLLDQYNIKFKAGDYSVNLRSEFYQFQLSYMPKDMQKHIWQCMSKQQKDKFRERLGF
ncbi:PWWP domain-containing protein [Vibrio coralliilyticus]|uniref:hypothetical protein n=1 Tax=Vibrio coralliilyticus TaxID=190893 RepID=UPI001E5F5473|nr:hypothetical protein [Vibrio coralliilyticus]MCC2521093.1 hypothetical protein [Vibrio coralliilyticus]